ncbi:acyl-CoA dehydrogenase family protein [Oceanicoccus sp. KOV_DT_Chl]|uniref:acyl-CoA dehydrogenase family protein n=1 Tax=Oceanicoccus sp. KOV_DT_Chl TaxID=1904639 RepID=UPI000C799AD0|nr:acyl-CoA dehydrogenase family protein [Oceanicoccus sp. KOV_DT_Chl]
MNSPSPSTGLAMAKSIEQVVTDNTAESEKLRTLSPAIVSALWGSGLMQWMNPAVAGGVEPGYAELIETWIELARQDGSAGWIGIANFPSTAFAAAYLPDQGFEEVFTANDNRITMGGQFFPNGTGAKVEGGYTVSGAWNFGSGTGHSEYVVGGFIPLYDGEMKIGDDGLPEMFVAVFPRDEITFTDNWHVQGLKGTGSYDYNAQEVFVPEHRIFPLFTREAKRGGHMYNLGVMPLTACGHAAWALGVSRSMLDDVVQLAKDKTRMGDPTTLANKQTFQRNMAHHEAMWRAAKLLVEQTFGDVEKQTASGAELTPLMRAEMRMAATYATEASREIVQWAHLAAGTSAIREGSRLERAFRDLYTGTQHAFINEKTYIDAAQVMLGIIEDSPGL